jgi:diaminopimelate epimerase
MIPKYFSKMAGGGNDFLVFLADGRKLSGAGRKKLARLCTRRLSIGADGALFVQPEADGTLRLDYYNADGGLAAFCANGTRCAARYAVRQGLVRADTAVLQTGWGAIRAEIHDEFVTLQLPDVPSAIGEIPIDSAGLPPTATAIAVGVPHLVVFVETDLEAVPVEQIGPLLRRHPALPEGANVDFVRVLGRSGLAVRTYERGVEAETLSCGTGAVASSVVAALAGRVRPPVVCKTRSGIDLTVELRLGEERVQGVRLTGDARFVFEGEIGEDADRWGTGESASADGRSA